MIGVAGPELPHEVLHAALCHGGALSFDPARATPRASTWVEARFAPWAAPLLESWAEGAYEGLTGVLFSRADDTSQRLYYYVTELQRRGEIGGPEPLIFDLARIPRDISRDRTVEQVRALAARLDVGDAALEAAIAAANMVRANPPALEAGPRCLIAGSAPPDRRLHDAVAAAGFVAVGSTLAEQWADPGDRVAEGTGDPAAAIGHALHARRGGPRSFADPAALLTEQVQGCAAAVLWRIEEDEAQCWHLPAEMRALDAAGVPYLVLTRRDWLGLDGAASEIGDFLAGLGQ